jgi:PadR family transcriptional regulator AphA
MSGYDIRKEVATSVGYFWSESFGQIYPALRELQTRGFVKRREGVGPRERRVYEITRKGRSALRAWRAVPPRAAPVRSELLLKLFFASPKSVARELTWLEGLEAREASALLEFGRIRRQLRSEQSAHPSLPFWLAVLSYGEQRSRASLRWCRETQATLRGLQESSTRKVSR